jgi:hypothetical protein
MRSIPLNEHYATIAFEKLLTVQGLMQAQSKNTLEILGDFSLSCRSGIRSGTPLMFKIKNINAAIGPYVLSFEQTAAPKWAR